MRAMGMRSGVWVAAVAAAWVLVGCRTLHDASLAGIARHSGAGTVVPLGEPERLAAVVEHARLPMTFACSGIIWQAAGLGGFRSESRLSPVRPGIDGYALMRERGTREGEAPRLYLRAGPGSPFAGAYVRYEPVP